MILNWYDEWDLSDLENKGKISVRTELPRAIELGEQIELPKNIEVKIGGKNRTVSVDWEISDDLLSTPGPKGVNGRIPELNNKTITHNLYVIPNKVAYFVNPGSTLKRTEIGKRNYQINR